MDLQATKDRLEIVKSLFQIVAIVIAGIWTYMVFIRSEAPLLEVRADATSGLSWSPIDANSCVGTLDVTLKNIGKSPFEIAAFQLRAWQLPEQLASGEPIRFIDIDKAQRERAPLFERRFETGTFVHHYSPDTSFHHSFQWLVPKRPQAPMLFRIDLCTQADDGCGRGEARSTWHTASWGSVCPAPAERPQTWQ